MGGEKRVDFGVYEDVGRWVSSSCFDERRKHGAYRDVLENYNELRRRSEDLDVAKSKILRYFAN